MASIHRCDIWLYFRVVFGTNNIFVFHSPSDYAKQQKEGKEVATPTYDSAQEEIAEVSGLKALFGSGKPEGKETTSQLILVHQNTEIS